MRDDSPRRVDFLVTRLREEAECDSGPINGTLQGRLLFQTNNEELTFVYLCYAPKRRKKERASSKALDAFISDLSVIDVNTKEMLTKPYLTVWI